MPYNFESTDDYIKSISQIETLREFAVRERNANNEDNRKLFLKLAIVSSVTKFQVFVESILKEFLFHVKNSNKKYEQVSDFLRLNSIRIFSSENILHKSLENPEAYDSSKLIEIRSIAEKTLKFCLNDHAIDEDLKFDTKFPLGKTGLSDLVKLFKQIKGEDIFQKCTFDINKLNEILARRHAIIHEDSNQQVTEVTVEGYRDYLLEVVVFIDDYLEENK